MRKRARKKRKQSTDFKKVACCLSAVVQRTALQKNGLCERRCWSNLDPRGGQKPFIPNRKGVETAPPR